MHRDVKGEGSREKRPEDEGSRKKQKEAKASGESCFTIFPCASLSFPLPRSSALCFTLLPSASFPLRPSAEGGEAEGSREMRKEREAERNSQK